MNMNDMTPADLTPETLAQVKEFEELLRRETHRDIVILAYEPSEAERG